MIDDDWSDFIDAALERKRIDNITKPPPSPRSNGQTPNPGDHSAYINAALTRELDQLANTPKGQRNSALNIAALKLGGLPLDRDQLRDRLLDACQSNGLIADDGQASAEATIRSGFGKADRDGPRTIPLPPEPDEPYDPGPSDDDQSDEHADDEPTTWEPLDLGPWLNGEITQPQPTLGLTRSDGLRLIYPGREHAILGETECGKTWLALGCVAAELAVGNTSSTSTTRKATPAPPSNGCGCSASTPPR